jgi:hypothetical protein
MSTQATRSVGATTASSTPHWLWTWNGSCFGYRQGQSLFTWDGVEVGRFSGSEVYGPDGKYLGEIKKAQDGDRLIASSYKKSSTRAAFVPTFQRGRTPAGNRAGESLYCGYEDFPSAETIKGMVVELKKSLKSFASVGRLQ